MPSFPQPFWLIEKGGGGGGNPIDDGGVELRIGDFGSPPKKGLRFFLIWQFQIGAFGILFFANFWPKVWILHKMYTTPTWGFCGFFVELHPKTISF